MNSYQYSVKKLKGKELIDYEILKAPVVELEVLEALLEESKLTKALRLARAKTRDYMRYIQTDIWCIRFG